MSKGDSKFRNAVALSYTGCEASVPYVSARGSECGADEIVRLARRYGVPLHSQPELSAKLDKVELNQEISPDCYFDVARIFYQLESLKKVKK